MPALVGAKWSWPNANSTLAWRGERPITGLESGCEGLGPIHCETGSPLRPRTSAFARRFLLSALRQAGGVKVRTGKHHVIAAFGLERPLGAERRRQWPRPHAGRQHHQVDIDRAAI